MDAFTIDINSDIVQQVDIFVDTKQQVDIESDIVQQINILIFHNK